VAKIAAIVREDLAAGFALAGVEVQRVTDARELRRALAAAVHGSRFAVVVVEQELMAGLGEAERAAFNAVVVPLVIEVPGELAWKETDGGPAEDYVARLIRRAVGYQLNIRL